MKKEVTKAPKIALCRMCRGTGVVSETPPGVSFAEEQRRMPCLCPQCEGSGRVMVSTKMYLDIRPYKSKV